MAFINDLKYKYNRLNVLEKLIVFNTLIFLVCRIPIIDQFAIYFKLPSDMFDLLYQPWSIITYAFFHYDFMHLLFNMIWLYFVGQLLLNLFNPKTALNIYFLGAFCGGLLYLFGYNVLPQFFSGGTYLVGASAAVRALLIFLCAYMPNKDVRFFTFNIKLLYIGLVLIALDLAGLFGNNSGGNLAHLGGALLGYFYGNQLKSGTDIGKGFERIMGTVSGWFDFSKKAPLKTVHKKQSKDKVAGYNTKEFQEFNDQKKIDLILDKISKSGYDSLSAKEKEYLFKAGKK